MFCYAISLYWILLSCWDSINSATEIQWQRGTFRRLQGRLVYTGIKWPQIGFFVFILALCLDFFFFFFWVFHLLNTLHLRGCVLALTLINTCLQTVFLYSSVGISRVLFRNNMNCSSKNRFTWAHTTVNSNNMCALLLKEIIWFFCCCSFPFK